MRRFDSWYWRRALAAPLSFAERLSRPPELELRLEAELGRFLLRVFFFGLRVSSTLRVRRVLRGSSAEPTAVELAACTHARSIGGNSELSRGCTSYFTRSCA